MSKYLLNTTEVYRVDSEQEAENLINSAKEDSRYTVSKYQNQYKEIKQKGEVVETYHKVSITKTFTPEKEPIEQFEINYEN